MLLTERFCLHDDTDTGSPSDEFLTLWHVYELLYNNVLSCFITLCFYLSAYNSELDLSYLTTLLPNFSKLQAERTGAHV